MIRKAAMIAVGRRRHIVHTLSLRFRRQWQSQQMAFIGEPDFARVHVNPEIAVVQNQLRQFDEWRECEILGIVSSYIRDSLLRIGNRRPELVRIPGRLQFAGESFPQRYELTPYLLNRSVLRVEQIIDLAQTWFAMMTRVP